MASYKPVWKRAGGTAASSTYGWGHMPADNPMIKACDEADDAAKKKREWHPLSARRRPTQSAHPCPVSDQCARMAVRSGSGYAPAYHKDGKGVAHTAETILFCGGNNAAFGSEVGIATIPFGGCVVMLDANECGHAACLSMDDAVLKGKYAEFGVACKEGVSIAHLRRLEELDVDPNEAATWAHSFVNIAERKKGRAHPDAASLKRWPWLA
eukprot:COSAG06_NODE_22557_length_719_cov_2.259677_1_plen_210_part_01